MRDDRIAFLDGFTTDFFGVGGRYDLISEPNRLYHREIAALTSPKGTLDCVDAFGRAEFRDDLAKIDIPS